MTKRIEHSYKRESSEAGFTLVEVMIAMAVVSIVLIGIMIGNTVIQQASEAAFERTRAMQDAQSVVEDIRERAQNVADFPADVVDLYGDGDAIQGYDSLPNQQVTISYEDSDGDGVITNDDPLDITVSVSWLENGRRAATTSLRAMVTQR